MVPRTGRLELCAAVAGAWGRGGPGVTAAPWKDHTEHPCGWQAPETKDGAARGEGTGRWGAAERGGRDPEMLLRPVLVRAG